MFQSMAWGLACLLLAGSAFAESTVVSFPKDHQLYPRNLTNNTAEVMVSGSFANDAYRSVRLRVQREKKVHQVWSQKAGEPGGTTTFLFPVSLPAELANYSFVLECLDREGNPKQLASAKKVVAGDVFVINGQSNAAAGLFSKPGEGKADANDFVRSYGSMFKEDLDEPWPNVDEWSVVRAECRPFSQFTACAGRWGLRFASNIVKQEQVPIAIINHARGGKPIGYFARNPVNSNDLTTNFGTLLTRLQNGEVDRSIRGMLWFQGESDRLDPQAHMDGFTALYKEWEATFPTIERYYVFQIRHTCVPRDKEFGQGSQIANFQREFARTRTSVTAVSTTALDGHDGCHFAYKEGYQKLGDNVSRIVRGELYDDTLMDADAPDLQSVKRSGPRSLDLTFTASNTLVGEKGFESLFKLVNQNGDELPIVSGVIKKGTTVQLTLKAPVAKGDDLRLSYLSLSREQPWLTNQSGIGILSFLNVPVETTPPRGLVPVER